MVNLLFRRKKLKNFSKFDYAKKIIRKGIGQKISFAELREQLPDWRKRPLQSLIFDVMEELGLHTIPFEGMVTRPRLTRPAIPVSADGDIYVKDLLLEKGFTAENCAAYANIGKKKITITIKQNKQ